MQPFFAGILRIYGFWREHQVVRVFEFLPLYARRQRRGHRCIGASFRRLIDQVFRFLSTVVGDQPSRRFWHEPAKNKRIPLIYLTLRLLYSYFYKLQMFCQTFLDSFDSERFEDEIHDFLIHFNGSKIFGITQRRTYHMCISKSRAGKDMAS